MAYPQDGLASHIASPAGGWEPQRSAMGVIQLAIPQGVTSGTADTIMLSVKSATLPERKIETSQINYLAGYSNVATRLVPPGEFSMVVHDYVDIGTYDVMHDWAQLVFDQTTGFIGYASSHKSSGTFLEFGPAAKGASPTITRRWLLIGMLPTTLIPSREMNYDSNDPVTLTYTFAVDDYQYLGRNG